MGAANGQHASPSQSLQRIFHDQSKGHGSILRALTFVAVAGLFVGSFLGVGVVKYFDSSVSVEDVSFAVPSDLTAGRRQLAANGDVIKGVCLGPWVVFDTAFAATGLFPEVTLNSPVTGSSTASIGTITLTKGNAPLAGLVPMHFHVNLCGSNQAGVHWENNPALANEIETNEFWLNFTPDPTGTGSVATQRPFLAVNPLVAGPLPLANATQGDRPRSVVIHDPAVNPATGKHNKVLCCDLTWYLQTASVIETALPVTNTTNATTNSNATVTTNTTKPATAPAPAATNASVTGNVTTNPTPTPTPSATKAAGTPSPTTGGSTPSPTTPVPSAPVSTTKAPTPAPTNPVSSTSAPVTPSPTTPAPTKSSTPGTSAPTGTPVTHS